MQNIIRQTLTKTVIKHKAHLSKMPQQINKFFSLDLMMGQMGADWRWAPGHRESRLSSSNGWLIGRAAAEHMTSGLSVDSMDV